MISRDLGYEKDQLCKLADRIIAAGFVLVFVYTAIKKFRTPVLFESKMERSPLLFRFSKILVWLIPVIELILAVLLVIPQTRKTGLILPIGLLGVFTIYISYMILVMPHLPCSCGGVLPTLTWRAHLIFNTGFILLGIAGLCLPKYIQPGFYRDKKQEQPNNCIR